ncbi:OLC1v1010906C1 [Oldenlandia corymbosa var. corymbosa]|uniref:mannan endo-1,4-beta-mannosidase n=1 Tax=Oldenlandia corymbosa var. corymbosa TaxID=529605 RepID=A0AAV1DSI3_OLDCO|nr:OLC1v1010906C1 [Oldenlandia corymbosa var. corymbosa]
MELEGLFLHISHISPPRNHPLLYCFSSCCYYPHFQKLSQSHHDALSLNRPRRNSIPKAFKKRQSTNSANEGKWVGVKLRDGEVLVAESQVLEEQGYDEEYDYMSSISSKMGSLHEDEEVSIEDEASLSLLSLSEKPDRNMALLDDYELEELDFATDVTGHRSGFVAVVGKPNVGKSTLSNQMVGQKLSIVTDKPQTTRHRILGICSGEDYQMILYDTPGVIEKKMHKLDAMMMNNVRSAAINADCVLVVVDACKPPQKIDEVLEEGVCNLKDKVPILLVLNKKDKIKPGEIAKKLEWYEKFTDVDEVIPVSAKYGHGVDDVKDWILSKLPCGPALYPKDIASEHPERFFVAEIVREKIFMQYRNEVPYACQVNVVSYKTRPDAKDFIQVEVVVEKETQKAILIGKEGKALKLLATAARLDIEDFLQKKVFLEVEVKVKENWRQNEGLLRHYGYTGNIQGFTVQVEAGDGFVRTRGIHFQLNGSPYYANGFNAYWLMYVATDPSQRSRISEAFRQASSHGLTVARTWAFNDGGYRALQYAPGAYNEEAFKGLDFVVAEARRYGIKLILSLANNYENFGGKKQYVDWARSRGQYLTSEDDFFRNSVTRGFYKNHIRTVLNRYNTFTGIAYKNDPTIMAWELMNEPRCTSDPSGRTIQAWIAEMASYVKSIDRNHLLEAGLEGFYGPSTPQRTQLNPGYGVGTDFVANNRIPWIDFATVHSYPDVWLSSSDDQTQISFMNQWLGAHFQDAQHMIGKPIMVGEFGKSWKDSGFNSYKRDALFNDVYFQIYSSAKHGGPAAGALFWQLLTEGMDNMKDGYEIILSEGSSTANVIAQQSYKLHLLQKIFTRLRNVERWKRWRDARRSPWIDRNKGRRIGN